MCKKTENNIFRLNLNGFIAFCSGEKFSLCLTATVTLTKKYLLAIGIVSILRVSAF